VAGPDGPPLVGAPWPVPEAVPGHAAVLELGTYRLLTRTVGGCVLGR
jgi:hypothetical protein